MRWGCGGGGGGGDGNGDESKSDETGEQAEERVCVCVRVVLVSWGLGLLWEKTSAGGSSSSFLSSRSKDGPSSLPAPRTGERT